MYGNLKIPVVFVDLNDMKNTVIDLLHILQRANDSEIKINGSGYNTLLLLEQLTEAMCGQVEESVNDKLNAA